MYTYVIYYIYTYMYVSIYIYINGSKFWLMDYLASEPRKRLNLVMRSKIQALVGTQISAGGQIMGPRDQWELKAVKIEEHQDGD